MRPFTPTLAPPSKQMSTEFVKQTMRDNLTRTLVPHVADGLWSVYDNAKTACERNNQPEKILQTFQNLLTGIPKWNTDTLDKEVDRIAEASRCDYMEDLLLGVFVSYIRAFASLQQSEATHVNIEFQRPSLSKFIHAYYIAVARKCWTSAYLFKTTGISSEQQARNRREIETLLEGTVGEVIDSFIPWREVSKAYFHAKEEAATVSKPPPVKFEDKPQVREYETDEEEDEDDEDSEEEKDAITLGEDVELSDDDKDSVNTEDDILQRAEKSGTVALNL
jgi:hypothetical protein